VWLLQLIVFFADRLRDISLQISMFSFESPINENLNEIFVTTSQFSNRKLLVLPKF